MAETKPTKGELFKKKHGITKTMKRNMQKYDLVDPDDYRTLRKKRRKTEREAAKTRHIKSKAGRKAKDAKKVPTKKK